MIVTIRGLQLGLRHVIYNRGACSSSPACCRAKIYSNVGYTGRRFHLGRIGNQDETINDLFCSDLRHNWQDRPPHIPGSTTGEDNIGGIDGSSEATTAELINRAVVRAVQKAFGDGVVAEMANSLVFPGKAGFGDYQCNIAMSLAKKLKAKPRDIADTLVIQLENDKILMADSGSGAGVGACGGVLDRMDVSGPGFINLHLADNYIERRLSSMLSPSPGIVKATFHNDTDAEVKAKKKRLGIPMTRHPQRVVVDYSSPNIAKEMHVGHLRSTIIGDCLSSILEFLGHDVLRLNHVGDWGTQFGMLIHYLNTNYPDALQSHAGTDEDDRAVGTDADLGINIGDLVEFYKASKRCFDEDPAFQQAARQEVVRLQAGEARSLRAWKAICHKSRVEFQRVYDLLGIRGLQERGESFYNPMLPALVQQLREKGSAVESNGALCIFLDGYQNSDGSPLPLIVQKSDGGFLYATTDLAALLQRVQQERAQRLIYVTDAGQAQHFKMVFEAGRKAGILPPAAATVGAGKGSSIQVQHVPFGLVLGEDGKKIKSRAGDSVKLRELLDEAVRTTEKQFLLQTEPRIEGQASGEQSELLDEDKQMDCSMSVADRARIMGIAAVKYADLSMNRESNYRFSFTKMLSLSGNTAPYMLYAYVRILGIQRKASRVMARQSESQGVESAFILVDAQEAALARHLIRFEEVLHEVAQDLYPNKLCDYIFELSQKFNQFYEHCPVLRAPSVHLLRSRTQLCTLTADTLKTSLDLLGIETIDKL